jgi:hypothetical protein
LTSLKFEQIVTDKRATMVNSEISSISSSEFIDLSKESKHLIEEERLKTLNEEYFSKTLTTE